MPEPDFYDFLDGKVTYAEVMPDPTKKSMTKLMKVISITRQPGGRIAHIGFDLQKGPVELEIDEPTARAIVKLFDDTPAEEKPAT